MVCREFDDETLACKTVPCSCRVDVGLILLDIRVIFFIHSRLKRKGLLLFRASRPIYTGLRVKLMSNSVANTKFMLNIETEFSLNFRLDFGIYVVYVSNYHGFRMGKRFRL